MSIIKKFKNLFSNNGVLNRNFNQILGKITNSQNICPICGRKSTFNSFGNPKRKHVECPHCHSLERDRVAYILLMNNFDYLFNRQSKVLHFAPEEYFYNFFKNNDFIDYYPVDFNPELFEEFGRPVREKVDMENIPYGDNTFDLIYNSHVLEHVPNDVEAMKELYRVCNVGGVCVVIAPIFFISETLEKEEYNTPELRLKYYHQEDHLRKYGEDFKNRLISVGFDVEEVKPIDLVENQNKVDLYKLVCSEAIFYDGVFVCRK